MLEWQVDEPAPPPLDETTQTRWRPSRRLMVVGVLLLIMVASGAFFFLRQREAQLLAELNTHVLQESRAQASGNVTLAATLADNTAADNWQVGYQRLFRQPYAFPAPVVQQANLAGEVVTVEVQWATFPPLLERRAYRFMEGQWRRTPLFIPRDQETLELRTTHFAFEGPVTLVNDLASTPGLQLNLEGLRRRVATYWQDTWEEYFLTVRIAPSEFAPAVYGADARTLQVNSLPLTPFDPALPLSPQSQYRMGVTEGVVQWLTTPDWIRDLNADPTLMDADAQIASHDWFVLLKALQDAEARHWALSEDEINRLNAHWREVVNGQWVDPFTAPLPERDSIGNENDAQRHAMLMLMLERQIEVGGIETAGRLARVLQEYPSVNFDSEQFFSALIGGSPTDVQSQMELWLAQEP